MTIKVSVNYSEPTYSESDIELPAGIGNNDVCDVIVGRNPRGYFETTIELERSGLKKLIKAGIVKFPLHRVHKGSKGYPHLPDDEIYNDLDLVIERHGCRLVAIFSTVVDEEECWEPEVEVNWRAG